jgi:hypothetical protein
VKWVLSLSGNWKEGDYKDPDHGRENAVSLFLHFLKNNPKVPVKYDFTTIGSGQTQKNWENGAFYPQAVPTVLHRPSAPSSTAVRVPPATTLQ